VAKDCVEPVDLLSHSSSSSEVLRYADPREIRAGIVHAGR